MAGFESIRRSPQTSPDRSCIASFLRDDVPLSVGLTQPCRNLPSRHRSWDLALRSFIPARGRRPTLSIAAGPTCRFLSVHPDRGFMLSGDQPSLIHISTPLCVRCTHFPDTRRDGRSRTLTAAPGFGPQAIRAAQTLFVRAGRCCPGL
jgi:hypothetical protein